MSDQTALSISDRQLLREVFRWTRANGWRPSDDNELSNRDWCPAGDEPNVFVNLHRPNYGDNGEDRFGNSILRVYSFGGKYRCVQVPDTSVREAVDVLCALGVLPATLSSQWQAALSEEQWRVVYPVRRGVTNIWASNLDTLDEAEESRANCAQFYEDSRIERRRFGHTDWEQVPE